MNKLFPILFFSLFLFEKMAAQVPMEVIRTKAVDRYSPVTNIYIDAENNKWVGNRKGLTQVFSPEQGNPVNLAPAEWSLLQTPSGNYDLRIPLDELISQMGKDGEAIRSKDDRITAATFDEKRSELWVGTRNSGLFQFKTQPALKLMQRHHSGNSKLGSNRIHTLLLDSTGRLWIGTEEGCTYGKDGKWSLEEKYFSIKAFAQNETDMWIMGNDLLWKVNARNFWEPIDIDEKLTEGEVVAIAFDSNGLLWIASEIIARFDPATETFKIFGPADEFTSQNVSCMAIDRENAVWIGTNDKGLYVIQKADAMAVNCQLEKPLSCGANKKDAALKVLVDGGESPYTYQWTGGLNGANPQNLGPGEYTLTVTDAKGKSKITKITIPDPNLLLTVAQDKPAADDGADSGSATVKVQGGNPAYSFKWDNGETTASATKLGEGQHAVTVTDKSGCAATATLNITRKVGALAITISQIQNIQCAGNADASLKAEITGGKAPYQYQWTNGVMTGETVTGLPAGNHAVTVTDAVGQSATAKIIVAEPKAVAATVKVDAPASTGNADGKATVSPNGGSGNFTFKWDNGETAATATRLAPGRRSVTVTDEAGCTTTATVTISENVLPLAVSILQKQDVKCPGQKTAALTAEVSGGKAPFKYSWNANGFTTESLSGIPAGGYAVTITDATGQTASADWEVKAPKTIEATAKVDAPASTGNADGKATAKASGGAGNFTFRWDNGETTPTANKLAPGNHVVTVTDEAGCEVTVSIAISENILPLAVSISQSQEIKCAGEKSAGLAADVSGGKGPFQFAWTGGALGEMASSLAAGSYTVTVTDATGATAANQFSIKEPKPVEITAKVDASASTGNADGKATAKANGGSGNFKYRWDNGETTATATKLAPGNHTVTVTDEAGCEATTTVSISENILPLAVSISQSQEIKCAGEKSAALAVDASGGKGPFQFAWSGGASGEMTSSLAAGAYGVTVTDATGTTAASQFSVKEPKAVETSAKVDAPASTGNADGKATAKATGGSGNFTYRWDNGETAATAAKLAPGNHTVTVTDEAGCEATATVSISENILPLAVNVSQKTEIKCAGEKSAALAAEVSGGKGPFKFAWTSGASGETVSSLAAGSYDVTVTDATGTTASKQFLIKEPKTVEATAKVDAPASTGNADGKATAKASGGTGNFSFRWDNGETAATAIKLAPGNHAVTITDEAGCEATASVSVSENILPLAVNVSQKTDIKCAGEKSAALAAEVSGGKGPFKFGWTGGASGETASSLAAGTYMVTVTDATGTTAVSQFLIKEPKTVEATAKVDAPTSTGNADGKATAKASGGTGNFSFRWDNGETTATATKLAPGNHTVTVTDEAGCEATATVSISENILPLAVNISQKTAIKCAGEKTAALAAEVSGGKGPFKFAWTGGASGESAASLAAGSYDLTVTDATGTTATAKFAVQEPSAIRAEVTKTRPTSTEKTTNGKAFLKVDGGAGGYTFKWDNGETTVDAGNLGAGAHSVTITDANGCQTVLNVETKIRIIPELTAETLRSGEVIKLEKIYFQPDSTNMDVTSLPTVDELFEFLEENPGIVIEVGGHTNNIPSHEFCDALSSARAKSVAQYLVEKGLPVNRITYRGYGKRNPIATNATPEGRAKNQRVEIKIVRLDGD